VVRHISDSIAVMYLGKIMEVAPAEELYSKPIHPYTQALLGAIPIPDPELNRRRHRAALEGEPPSAIAPPDGCRFHPRCPFATDICRTVEPPLAEYAGGHLAACHHPGNVSASEIAAATRSEMSPLSAGPDLPSANGNGGDPAAAPEPAETMDGMADTPGEPADADTPDPASPE
jgi:oligopeptide/dipeptide ABC transporter ATP-binding protein